MIELAGCVIRNTDGEILLLHRNTEKLRQWELPGGKLDPGEDAEEAAVREIKEELGVDVSVIRRLGAAAFLLEGKDWHYTWFEAEVVDGGEPYVAEPETFDDLQYWAIEALSQKNDLSVNVTNLLGKIINTHDHPEL